MKQLCSGNAFSALDAARRPARPLTRLLKQGRHMFSHSFPPLWSLRR